MNLTWPNALESGVLAQWGRWGKGAALAMERALFAWGMQRVAGGACCSEKADAADDNGTNMRKELSVSAKFGNRVSRQRVS